MSRTDEYAKKLSLMIQKETVSEEGQTDKTKFYEFHELMKELFPNVFAKCEIENFNASLLLRWKGRENGKPSMFMNHHDVVEAPGEWKYPPFSGEIAEGKVWGRGTLDDKGGLFGMLQAADELIAEGYVPKNDIYFESACTEETDGSGADSVTKALAERGIKFSFCLDEGGMIIYDPIGGVDGTFAMVGVGEKALADLKFIAKSNGGHASTPGKNTPLVRLGKFMAACDRSNIFNVEMADPVAEMLRRMAPAMKPPLKNVLGNPEKFKKLLSTVMTAVSPTAGALLKTTLAFTMAQGSAASNVLPQEAYVIGNMRASHHQGTEKSIEAVRKLAAKYDIEVEVVDMGVKSHLSSYKSKEFKTVENAVAKFFKNVNTAPYIMTGASDSRYMSRVCENCLRFTPFIIDSDQLASIHGLNENVDLSCLEPAVDFYKYLMKQF